MSIEDIVARVNDFDTEALSESLHEAPEPTCGGSKKDIIDSTLRWLDALRQDLVMLVSKVGGGEDVDMVLAIQYVEMKSRWIAFNTKMNYTMFKGEQPDVSDMCRAAAVSALLGHIEPLLRQEDVDHITEFLARPIGNAA
ncbi:MAG: hypothetical protein AAFY46_01610 [Planctomycetota bacterium]